MEEQRREMEAVAKRSEDRINRHTTEDGNMTRNMIAKLEGRVVNLQKTLTPVKSAPRRPSSISISMGSVASVESSNYEAQIAACQDENLQKDLEIGRLKNKLNQYEGSPHDAYSTPVGKKRKVSEREKKALEDFDKKQKSGRKKQAKKDASGLDSSRRTKTGGGLYR